MKIIRPISIVFYGLLAAILAVGLSVVGSQVMAGGVWLGVVPVVVLGWLGLRRPLRRWRLTHQPLAQKERAWIMQHVPLYTTLDAAGRRRFEHDVLFFLDEQMFEAIEGVEITEGLRLAVAAGAAMLLHGRPDWELGSSRTILFYPDRFDEDYYDTDYAVYDGMVHAQGPVILSAQAVKEDWEQPGTGRNVVLHELAHLFDFDDAHAEGTPSLMDPKSATAWQQLVRREMQRARLGKSLLRRYASTNPAEFFAVAVENFFDRPEVFRQRHPQVYEALVAFFNLDPRTGQPGGVEANATTHEPSNV